MKSKALFKWGVLIKGTVFRKGGRGSFAIRCFYNTIRKVENYKNLKKSPNYS
jgi:hypothetical protein